MKVISGFVLRLGDTDSFFDVLKDFGHCFGLIENVRELCHRSLYLDLAFGVFDHHLCLKNQVLALAVHLLLMKRPLRPVRPFVVNVVLFFLV